MYVRVLNFVCREETQKEDIQRVYRKVVEEAGSADGFIGSALLMKENACLGMAMMYWRDAEAAAKAGPGIVTILGEHIHDLLDHPPDIEGYHLIENGIITEAIQE
jgi:hypothetical protein